MSEDEEEEKELDWDDAIDAALADAAALFAAARAACTAERTARSPSAAAEAASLARRRASCGLLSSSERASEIMRCDRSTFEAPRCECPR
jgi:hypothetical protein